MTTDRVAEFNDLIAKEIQAPKLVEAGLAFRPYDAPAPWVADALLRARMTASLRSG